MTHRSSAALAAVLLLAAVAAHGATVTVASLAGVAPGDFPVTVPVSLASVTGEFISGLQVDVSFDAAALSLSKATAGASATAAGKSVSINQITAGATRVIVAGINQNVMPDGVVFNLVFSVKNAAAGVQPVTLTGLSLVASSGVHLPGATVDGAIEIVQQEGEGEGESGGGCFAKNATVSDRGSPADMTMLAAVASLLGLAALCRKKQ